MTLEQRRESQRRWRRANPERKAASHKRFYDKRKVLLREAKDQPCADCGGRFPAVCMQFDHVRGAKMFNLAHGYTNRALHLVKTEMKKCDVVCANCHAIRTESRRGEMA